MGGALLMAPQRHSRVTRTEHCMPSYLETRHTPVRTRPPSPRPRQLWLASPCVHLVAAVRGRSGLLAVYATGRLCAHLVAAVGVQQRAVHDGVREVVRVASVVVEVQLGSNDLALLAEADLRKRGMSGGGTEHTTARGQGRRRGRQAAREARRAAQPRPAAAPTLYFARKAWRWPKGVGRGGKATTGR